MKKIHLNQVAMKYFILVMTWFNFLQLFFLAWESTKYTKHQILVSYENWCAMLIRVVFVIYHIALHILYQPLVATQQLQVNKE